MNQLPLEIENIILTMKSQMEAVDNIDFNQLVKDIYIKTPLETTEWSYQLVMDNNPELMDKLVVLMKKLYIERFDWDLYLNRLSSDEQWDNWEEWDVYYRKYPSFDEWDSIVRDDLFEL